MSTRKVSEKRSLSNGRSPVPGDAAEPATLPDGAFDFDPEVLDARHLQDAVDNPGVSEIPEATAEGETVHVRDIPEANLDPDHDEEGELLTRDPALMVVKVDRPNPHTWMHVYPDRFLRTVLVAYRPTKDSSPEYHYVIPELQAGVKDGLKQVRVYLVCEAGSNGESFLWIVPESTFSPYFNSIEQVFARGKEYVSNHLFRFAKVELKKKICDVRVRPIRPDDDAPTLPSRPIGQLLPEALSRDKLITSTDHPVYRSLSAGGRLS